MSTAEIDTQTEPTNFETNSHEDIGFETADELANGMPSQDRDHPSHPDPTTLSDPTTPDEKLIKLLESYEVLKDRMDALQAERNVMREEIQSHMGTEDIGYSEVPVPSGRAYKVSLSNRIMETVTREGKSFIKVHATPELLDSLIRTTERETLAIREMTGVPRQSLFNRIQDDIS